MQSPAHDMEVREKLGKRCGYTRGWAAIVLDKTAQRLTCFTEWHVFYPAKSAMNNYVEYNGHTLYIYSDTIIIQEDIVCMGVYL